MSKASRNTRKLQRNMEVQKDDDDIDREKALELAAKIGGRKQDWSYKEYWAIYRRFVQSDYSLDHIKVLLMLCFKKFPDSTIREISDIHLEKQYRWNILTARLKEMELMGIIECTGKRRCMVSGYLARMWRVKDE